MLSGPVALTRREPRARPWRRGAGSGVTFTKQQPGAAAWKASGDGGALDAHDRRADGLRRQSRVRRARRRREASTPVDDIRLEIPIAADVARYLMGLGFKGGARPAVVRVDVGRRKNNQDSAWIGDINAGLQFTLKDDKYVRPLNTNFYTMKPLVMPASWFNGGKGGCRLAEKDASTYLVRCYSGARTVAPGTPLFFNFRLLLTPFKPIDTKAQFTTRFFHAFKPPDDVAQHRRERRSTSITRTRSTRTSTTRSSGPAEMKAYIDQAHARGQRVKIYYTVRELANRAPEMFALRSLGDEIFAPGPGGGFSWLQEHLGSNYIAAWFVPDLKDAAVVNSGVSRWHNFYVEGLRVAREATSASTASTSTTWRSTG